MLKLGSWASAAPSTLLPMNGVFRSPAHAGGCARCRVRVREHMLPFDTRVSELRAVRARPGTLGCGRCGRAAHGSRGSRATARRSRRSTSRPCRAALPVSKRGGDGRRVTLASCRRGSTPLALQLRTISGSSGTGSSAAAPSAGTGSGSVGSAASSVALTDSTTARRSKPLSTAHLRMAPRGRWGELNSGHLEKPGYRKIGK